MCCHPALSTASAIALTLRAVGGLTTAEIAKAFLVPEATIGQRISRAKQSIKASGIPFRLPDAEERAERLGAVLHVLYLVFNEGYTASAGAELHRADLSNEAIRLTRAVHQLLPNDGEVGGLLALMLLTDARRAARTGPDGELIPLDEQDRTLWNRESIAEGVALVSAALTKGLVGEYQLQAAIAAVHDEAARAGRDRLAADFRALQRPQADDRQPDGRDQSRDCRRDGAADQRRDWPCSRRCRTTSDCATTIGSTRPAPICSNAPVSTPRRRSCIEKQPRKQRACRREITCLRKRPARARRQLKGSASILRESTEIHKFVFRTL